MLPNALIAATGMLLIAALTPGPNNWVVLRAAANGGLAAAWPAIGGIVLGGLAMLGLAVVGLGSTFAQSEVLRTAVAVGGAAYLIWLGVSLMRNRTADEDGAPLPTGWTGLFGFQFLNPKSWAMVLTLVAAFPHLSMPATFAYLAPAFLLIPTACLLLWAAAGARLSAHFRNPTVRRGIDRAMGAALIVSAGLLLI